jgi:serine/threonine protein kinase
MAGLIGQDIGHYHIIEPLGEGGVAVIFRAFDKRLGCNVAIKFVRRGQALPEELDVVYKRFEREAMAMSNFTHPNIVPVLHYGEHNGIPYLVMPYLTGGSLKDMLKARGGEPMPYQEAARFLLPIAQALDYAHKQNIIHRDVKPANILLTDKGKPMLTDFGLAKFSGLKKKDRLTDMGKVVGTLSYMAPEQWDNLIIPETDVYALGVVFFEMVTGRVPYGDDTPITMLSKQAKGYLPHPRSFVPSLPLEVEQVLLKAMEREPHNRYVSMEEFAAVLERLACGILEGDGQVNRGKDESEYQSQEPLNKRARIGQEVTTKGKIPGWYWTLVGVAIFLVVVLLALLVIVLSSR